MRFQSRTVMLPPNEATESLLAAVGDDSLPLVSNEKQAHKVASGTRELSSL